MRDTVTAADHAVCDYITVRLPRVLAQRWLDFKEQRPAFESALRRVVEEALRAEPKPSVDRGRCGKGFSRL